MGDLILVFLIACCSLGQYYSVDVNSAHPELPSMCGSEPWMAEPEFVEFLDHGDVNGLDPNLQSKLFSHLEGNQSIYSSLIDVYGGDLSGYYCEGGCEETVQPDIIYEDTDDNQ